MLNNEHVHETMTAVAGGGVVGGSVYVTVAHMNIAEATAIATLSAAVATTLYFIVQALYVLWKWRKDAQKP